MQSNYKQIVLLSNSVQMQFPRFCFKAATTFAARVHSTTPFPLSQPQDKEKVIVVQIRTCSKDKLCLTRHVCFTQSFLRRVLDLDMLKEYRLPYKAMQKTFCQEIIVSSEPCQLVLQTKLFILKQWFPKWLITTHHGNRKWANTCYSNGPNYECPDRAVAVTVSWGSRDFISLSGWSCWPLGAYACN